MEDARCNVLGKKREKYLKILRAEVLSKKSDAKEISEHEAKRGVLEHLERGGPW
jgi:hypothetical protein